MPESSEVAGGDTALATQYNDLRKDVLDKDVGHTHSGEVDGGAAVGSPLIPKASQFLGDGSDGSLTLSAPTVFEGVKNFTDLTINSGGIITPATGKHFLFIFVSGTLTINSGGVIDMNEAGGAGGAGGVGPPNNAGKDGFATELASLPAELEGGQTSGEAGKRGGAQHAAISDAGDDIFVAYGAGGGANSTTKGGNIWAGGGAGNGTGIDSGGTGGAGGGCVVIFANNIIVNAGGIIRANGKAGGSGLGGDPTFGGGGGGGGLIYLAYRTLTSNGTIEALGGAGGGSTGNGGDGAPGIVAEKVIPG